MRLAPIVLQVELWVPTMAFVLSMQGRKTARRPIKELFGKRRIDCLISGNVLVKPGHTSKGRSVTMKRYAFAVKPIQVEYFMTQLPQLASNLNSAQNNLRYSAGLIFRFGAK